MNTEDQAHEYAKILLNHIMSEHGKLSEDNALNITKSAWSLTDLMKAEAEKREKEESAKKRVEIQKLLNADNTFIEREGQHFDDVNWQPDWSLAPELAKWWAMDKDGDVEVPAPFEPKEGDYFYVICPTSFTGYTEVFVENQQNLECFSKFGAWRTEDEIKQVVAALRQVFGGGK